MLGRGVDVDLDSIQAKLVAGRRGGYCYEQGQLFGAALERLGFDVDRLLARVGPDGEPMRPRTHLTLRVGADSGIWLADVGFGSSPPAPRSARTPRRNSSSNSPSAPTASADSTEPSYDPRPEIPLTAMSSLRHYQRVHPEDSRDLAP
jgi:arylamine N-acetyltransferase